jgi:hypothetical protein
MKPLILEFAENPELKDLDFSLIEYSPKDNLTVIKNTSIPAISYMNLETETFTRTTGEVSDADINHENNIRQLLDTSTSTFTSTEPSDSDNNHQTLLLLIDTKTITETIEPSDSDR